MCCVNAIVSNKVCKPVQNWLYTHSQHRVGGGLRSQFLNFESCGHWMHFVWQQTDSLVYTDFCEVTEKCTWPIVNNANVRSWQYCTRGTNCLRHNFSNSLKLLLERWTAFVIMRSLACLWWWCRTLSDMSLQILLYVYSLVEIWWLWRPSHMINIIFTLIQPFSDHSCSVCFFIHLVRILLELVYKFMIQWKGSWFLIGSLNSVVWTRTEWLFIF